MECLECLECSEYPEYPEYPECSESALDQLWFIPPLLFSVAAVYRLHQKGRLRQAIWLGTAGFAGCQFISGAFRSVWRSGIGSGWLTADRQNDLELFLTRYFGFGFTFVLAGVLIAKYEEAFRALKARILLLPALAVSIAETLLLLRYAEWTLDYKLAFSLLPNTVLLFFGVLKIKSLRIKRHHRLINSFSIVTFCGHIPFMNLNLLL